jgi:hypothetical protein
MLTYAMAMADSRVDAHTMLMLTFNEGSGDTARDSSSKGNHSELKGAEWVEGKFGNGVEFGSDGDCVVMPLSPDLDLTEELTIEAWVKPATVDVRMDIISKHEGGGYALIIDEGGIVRASFHIAGSYTPARSVNAVESDQWYYMAATFDGESLNVYIDGELEVEVPAAGAVTPTDVSLSIGGNSGPGGVVTSYFFKGTVDELRVSDIARTPDEIREAMETAGLVNSSGKLATTWAEMKIQL